jgi:hypothetical protein
MLEGGGADGVGGVGWREGSPAGSGGAASGSGGGAWWDRRRRGGCS